MEFLGHLVTLLFNIEKLPDSFPKWLHQVPPAVCEDSDFSASLPALVILCLSHYSQAGVWRDLPVVRYALCRWLNMWSIFHVLISRLYIFGEMSIRILCPFLTGYSSFCYDPLFFSFLAGLTCSQSLALAWVCWEDCWLSSRILRPLGTLTPLAGIVCCLHYIVSLSLYP